MCVRSRVIDRVHEFLAMASSTHASWLLAGGADLNLVMDRMGHAQVATTRRYLHTLPDADDRAQDAFQRTRSS